MTEHLKHKERADRAPEDEAFATINKPGHPFHGHSFQIQGRGKGTHAKHLLGIVRSEGLMRHVSSKKIYIDPKHLQHFRDTRQGPVHFANKEDYTKQERSKLAKHIMKGKEFRSSGPRAGRVKRAYKAMSQGW